MRTLNRQSMSRFNRALYDAAWLSILATIYAICVGLVR